MDFYNKSLKTAAIIFILLPILINITIGPLYDKYKKIKRNKLKKFKTGVMLTFGLAPLVYKDID